MINFKRDDKDAVVTLDLAVPTYDERVFSFKFGCGSEVYAGLLTEAMRKAFGNAVQAARREAYNDGWRDAKAKTAKRDWFGRNI